MPVGILRSSGRIVCVGSEATDFGGALSLGRTHHPAASAKAKPNILSLDMAKLLMRSVSSLWRDRDGELCPHGRGPDVRWRTSGPRPDRCAVAVRIVRATAQHARKSAAPDRHAFAISGPRTYIDPVGATRL